jgi:hypothetical protein
MLSETGGVDPPLDHTMALPFSSLCELWEQLCCLEMKDTAAVVRQWFERHALNISRQGRGGLALLSCLFPHKRPDRIYGLREKKLTGITVKAWGYRIEIASTLPLPCPLQSQHSVTGRSGSDIGPCCFYLHLFLSRDSQQIQSEARQPKPGADEHLQADERLGGQMDDSPAAQRFRSCAFS